MHLKLNRTNPDYAFLLIQIGVKAPAFERWVFIFLLSQCTEGQAKEIVETHYFPRTKEPGELLIEITSIEKLQALVKRNGLQPEAGEDVAVYKKDYNG